MRHYTTLKYRLFAFILLVLSIWSSSYAGRYTSATGEEVVTQRCVALPAPDIDTASILQEEKRCFLDVFTQAYESISAETLRVADKTSFLHRAFQEDIDDFGKPGVIHVRIESSQQELMAYMSIDVADQRKATASEYAKFPSESVYFRLLYVLPSFQRHGLARLMIMDVVKEFMPSVQHLYVATRRINERAITLYKSCGFRETAQPLHGLDPELYISLEKHL